MTETHDPKWLEWAKKLQAISQIGLTYATEQYDIDRYTAVQKIAAEMLAEQAEVDTEQVLELFSREKDYATPKVDVRGVTFKDDKILLVKETSDHKWAIPGGWADINEPPSESVEREVWEESGFKVKAKKLAAVYDRSRHPHEPLFQYHIYKLFFICDLISGKPTPSYETEEIKFFAENEIPDLSLTKVLPKQIQRMFEHHRNPNLPCDFD